MRLVERQELGGAQALDQAVVAGGQDEVRVEPIGGQQAQLGEDGRLGFWASSRISTGWVSEPSMWACQRWGSSLVPAQRL
jgi:hypothetical protein